MRREATSTIKIHADAEAGAQLERLELHVRQGHRRACDVTLENSVSVDTSLYILGDLCLDNSSAIVKAAAPDITNLFVGSTSSSAAATTIGTAANSRPGADRPGLPLRRRAANLDEPVHDAPTRVYATRS